MPKEKIINYGVRRFGNNIKQLMTLYLAQKEGNGAIIAMPNGNIYTEKAHRNATLKTLQELEEEQEELMRKYVTQPADYKGSDANVWREGYNKAIYDLEDIINSKMEGLK